MRTDDRVAIVRGSVLGVKNIRLNRYFVAIPVLRLYRASHIPINFWNLVLGIFP